MKRALPMACLLLSASAFAGKVEVVKVDITPNEDASYRFEVTLRHADSGWDHYADRWEILSPDGRLIATRALYHPHVDEQPFTRGLGHVEIPAGVHRVEVRGHDSVHGDGDAVAVELPTRESLSGR